MGPRIEISKLKGFKKAVIFIVSSLVVALTYSLLAEEKYTATVKFLPSQDQGGIGGPAAAMGSLGGLASSFGVSLGGQSAEKRLALFASSDTILSFIAANDLIGHMALDKSLDEPSRVVKYFRRDHFAFNTDLRSGVITLKMKWGDAQLAADLANKYFEFANVIVAEHKLREINLRLEFLEKELLNTREEPLRNSIFNLMELELRKKMDVETDPYYAFSLIEKAQVPYQRSWPRRSLIMILSALFSSAIAVGYLALLNLKQLLGVFAEAS